MYSEIECGSCLGIKKGIIKMKIRKNIRVIKEGLLYCSWGKAGYTDLVLMRHLTLIWAVVTIAQPGSTTKCVSGEYDFCVSEMTTNLRAVLALLLYIRKRHPPFR